jgi:hypothetical protein
VDDRETPLLATGDEAIEPAGPLTRGACGFAPGHPAPALAFARSAIASHPDRLIENGKPPGLVRGPPVEIDPRRPAKRPALGRYGSGSISTITSFLRRNQSEKGEL